MKCSWSVIQFGVREVPSRGEAGMADGEEEMDGGGLLIISHSQRKKQNWESSSHWCNGEFYYTPHPPTPTPTPPGQSNG